MKYRTASDENWRRFFIFVKKVRKYLEKYWLSVLISFLILTANEFTEFQWGAIFILRGLQLLLALYLIWFLAKCIKKFDFSKSSITFFAKWTIFFILFCFVFSPINLNKFDWFINLKNREQIIQLAEKHKLRLINKERSFYAIPDSIYIFPFNKYNHVVIGDTNSQKSVSVFFPTYEGILDHSEGFIYTSDSTIIKELELGNKAVKLNMNWCYSF